MLCVTQAFFLPARRCKRAFQPLPGEEPPKSEAATMWLTDEEQVLLIEVDLPKVFKSGEKRDPNRYN